MSRIEKFKEKKVLRVFTTFHNTEEHQKAGYLNNLEKFS